VRWGVGEPRVPQSGLLVRLFPDGPRVPIRLTWVDDDGLYSIVIMSYGSFRSNGKNRPDFLSLFAFSVGSGMAILLSPKFGDAFDCLSLSLSFARALCSSSDTGAFGDCRDPRWRETLESGSMGAKPCPVDCVDFHLASPLSLYSYTHTHTLPGHCTVGMMTIADPETRAGGQAGRLQTG
jgi:hypothetical protein